MIRRGEPVSEVIRLARQTAAEAVFVAGDVSRYAALRRQRLARECDRHRLALEITPGHAVVPPGDAARIFEPFFTTARARGGTGLGLPITRAIAASAGGTVELVPAVLGATFRIVLPKAGAGG